MIANGQTGLNVAFDLPTQMGYDSDHPLAEGEMGRVGMAVDSLADFETALRSIDLTKVSSGLTINALATIMLAMYEALARRLGVDVTRISATPQNGILKEIIVRGAYYALAAALGGARTTALCSYDEAYTIPTPKAALLSLRTLQILMDEMGLRDTVDEAETARLRF